MEEEAALVGADNKDVPGSSTNPSGDTNKDALAAAIAHASGKIEDGIHTVRKEAKQRHLVVVLSLLLAAVTPAVLWRSHTAALSPSIGALIVHFNTHFAVGMLGYALAEHRQHEGSERSADHVPATASDDEEEFRLLLLWIVAGLIAAVPALAMLAGLAWLVWHAGDYRIEKLIPTILFLLSVASVLGVFFVSVMQLRGSLVSPLGFVLISAYLATVFAFDLCSSWFLGDVAAMVITWVACLGLTGLFGYCLSVLATFKQINRTRGLV